MLIGQRDSSPLPGYTGKDFPQSKRSVIGGWLLTAIILRTLYQMIIPAEHLEPWIGTRWRWTELEYMQGFTLYVPIEINESECATVIEAVPDMKSSGNGRAITQLFCQAAKTREKYYDSCRSFTKLAMIMSNPYIKTQPVCAQDVPKLISHELTRPSTALVTLDAEFYTYWPMVQEFMRENQTIKFAYNNARTYGEDSKTPYLCVRTNLGRELYESIIRVRMAWTINSGIFQRWQQEAKESEQERIQALLITGPPILSSMRSSDVCLLYYLCGLILAASAGIFVLEGITWTIRSKCRNKKPLASKMDTSESDTMQSHFTRISSLIRLLVSLTNKK